MKTQRLVLSLLLVSAIYVGVAACGDEEVAPVDTTDGGGSADAAFTDSSRADVVNDRGPELTGQSCNAPVDCYRGLDAQSLAGIVTCLDRVTDGYCTHTCATDADCCAVPGECKTGLRQVCAPFESTGEKYCFLGCEAEDIATAVDAGVDAGTTEDDYCKREASLEFGCRSSGGGQQNRKVCVPVGPPGPPKDGGSDADASAADADADAN